MMKMKSRWISPANASPQLHHVALTATHLGELPFCMDGARAGLQLSVSVIILNKKCSWGYFRKREAVYGWRDIITRTAASIETEI